MLDQLIVEMPNEIRLKPHEEIVEVLEKTPLTHSNFSSTKQAKLVRVLKASGKYNSYTYILLKRFPDKIAIMPKVNSEELKDEWSRALRQRRLPPVFYFIPERESKWGKHNMSKFGAVGPHQVMYSIFKRYTANDDIYQVFDVFGLHQKNDPRMNAVASSKLASAYLKDIYESNGRDENATLVNYYAGEGAALVYKNSLKYYKSLNVDSNSLFRLIFKLRLDIKGYIYSNEIVDYYTSLQNTLGKYIIEGDHGWR